MQGHCAPAAVAAVVRPEDRELGVDQPDGRRLSRCLRCDCWRDGWPPAPGTAAYEVVPPLEELDLPRRGKPLEEAILLRLIALSRAAHSFVFGVLAISLVLVDTNIANLKAWASAWLARASDVAGNTGGASHDRLSRELQRIAGLNQHTLVVFAVTATAYCVLEGVEGWGLWHERRWAEYLTVIATSGFLPLEIHELTVRVTAFRIVALIVNIAIVAYLVWAKRLFGIRGGPAAVHEVIDWPSILTAPAHH